MGFQADVRAGALSVLDTFAQAQSIPLQIYPGRPRSIKAPTAFVDVMRETIEYNGVNMQRTVQADIVILWGTFDSADSVEQKDAFVDGYIEAVRADAYSAAGVNTTLSVVSTEDDPTFLPEWLPPNEQKTYYASRMTLEGYAGEQ